MVRIRRREKTRPTTNEIDLDFAEDGWVIDSSDAPDLTDRRSLAETLGRSLSDAMAMLRGGD